jgi:hypothetical protein
MVAQDFFDLLAWEAPVEPEKVQETPLDGSGARVGAGAGAAATKEAVPNTRLRRVEI